MYLYDKGQVRLDLRIYRQPLLHTPSDADYQYFASVGLLPGLFFDRSVEFY